MASIINATTTAGVSVAGDNSGSLQLATNNGTTAVTIDTNQRAAFVAGTAALPAITTTGDTNTGVFFPAADTIAFSEGGTESMRIDSAGVVSIKNTGSTADFVSETSTSLIVGNGSGTQAMTVYSGTANNGAIYFADGNTGDATYRGGVQYLHGSDAMRFFTSAAERMRIDSSGNVGFGTTTPNSGIQAGTNVCIRYPTGDVDISHANGTASGTGYIYFGYNAGIIGSITQNGTTATAYNTSSDYRLKEKIAPMTGALATVALLKPCTYTWKADGSAGQGFIAHELQEVVPDCVTGEKDAVQTYTDEDGNEQTRIKPQGVDTSFLVATLTAAIQELNTDLANTKLLLTEVSNKVEAQAVRIAELEGAR